MALQYYFVRVDRALKSLNSNTKWDRFGHKSLLTYTTVRHAGGGTLALAVTKLRWGSNLPSWLEARRSKVSRIVDSLSEPGRIFRERRLDAVYLSLWIDARYEHVYDDGPVRGLSVITPLAT